MHHNNLDGTWSLVLFHTGLYLGVCTGCLFAHLLTTAYASVLLLLVGCVCRFFYASSACIYPEHKQLETEVEGGGLKESDAWPAQVGGDHRGC